MERIRSRRCSLGPLAALLALLPFAAPPNWAGADGHLRPSAPVGWGLAPTDAATASDDDEKEPDPGPSEEEVEAMVERIESALDDGFLEEKLEALEAARHVPHDDVAKAVAKAEKDDAKEVRLACVVTLGHLRVDAALDTLHGWCKKTKTRMHEEAFAIEVFKALGRHGNTDSLKHLENGAINEERPLFEARILAMGRIHHADAVAEIVGIMNKLRATSGGRDGREEREENVRFMDVIQLALNSLTGADQGVDRRAWQSWWNDTKRDLELDPQDKPLMTRNLARKWRRYWGPEVGRRDQEKEDEKKDEDEEEKKEGRTRDSSGPRAGGGAR